MNKIFRFIALLGFALLLGLGQLGCDELCLPGQRQGACGLSGRCVKCFHGSHCKEGQKCGLGGVCTRAIPRGTICESDDDCYYYPEQCIDNRCTEGCRGDMDCEFGQRCMGGTCHLSMCLAEGRCSEGHVEEKDSIACIYSPCQEEGMRSGACGLTGACVECFHDSQCQTGRCTSQGLCQECACQEDSDCSADQRCLNCRCEERCATDDECPFPARCDSLSASCHTVRCDEQGTCGDWKYRPMEGSLACEYKPCDSDITRLVMGVCGQAEVCVDCIEDSDCEVEDTVCSEYGSCRGLRSCGPDGSYDCGEDLVCLEGLCLEPCQSDLDCRTGMGVCTEDQVCHYERCARDGTCPEGWAPMATSSRGQTMLCKRVL